MLDIHNKWAPYLSKINASTENDILSKEKGQIKKKNKKSARLQFYFNNSPVSIEEKA